MERPVPLPCSCSHSFLEDKTSWFSTDLVLSLYGSLVDTPPPFTLRRDYPFASSQTIFFSAHQSNGFFFSPYGNRGFPLLSPLFKRLYEFRSPLFFLNRALAFRTSF